MWFLGWIGLPILFLKICQLGIKEFWGIFFCSETVLAITNLELPSISGEDSLCWTANKNGRFSVKSSLNVLQGLEDRQEEDNFWKIIWKSSLQERLKLFSRWEICLDGLVCDSIKEVVKMLSEANLGSIHNSLLLIVTCLWYMVWSLRNRLWFHGQFDLQVAVARFENSVDEFTDAKRETLIHTKGPSLSFWKPPRPGRLLINVDASVGGGRSAWAMIVRNH